MDLGQRLAPALVPDALAAFALVHAHGAARARVEDRLNYTDDCAAAPAGWLNWFRSRLSLCCVHEHLEYRSSRLSVSPWDYGVIVRLGADERGFGGRGYSPPAFRSSASRARACSGPVNSSLINSDGFVIFSGQHFGRVMDLPSTDAVD